MNVEGTSDDPELSLGPVDIYVNLQVPLCAVLLLVAVRPSQSLRLTKFDFSHGEDSEGKREMEKGLTLQNKSSPLSAAHSPPSSVFVRVCKARAAPMSKNSSMSIAVA